MLRSATIVHTPARHLLRVNLRALDLAASLPLIEGGRKAREARFPAHFPKRRSSAQPHNPQHACGELTASTRATRTHHLCHSSHSRDAVWRSLPAHVQRHAHTAFTHDALAARAHASVTAGTRACEPGRVGGEYSKFLPLKPPEKWHTASSLSNELTLRSVETSY